jgi:murein L,D-transpeptidase YafK
MKRFPTDCRSTRRANPLTRLAAALAFAMVLFAGSPAPALAQNGNIGLGRAPEVVQRVQPKLAREADRQDLKIGAPVFIRIFKEEKELEVWLQGEDGTFRLFKTYPICAFSGDLGPKIIRGDGQAPEGFYFVTAERLNPWSTFHLSFDLGFPNGFDRAHGRTGSDLMVHGNCVSIGCYAMTDGRIEEIYTIVEAALDNGQRFFRVHAFPFRMTGENMARHSPSPWAGFWRNLKEGYDHFETDKRPPDADVRDGGYIFRRELP